MADQTAAHTEKVQLLFNAKAASWPAKYAPNGPLAGRLTGLGNAVGYHVATGGRVLDLGCGTGELARHLAAAGLRVTACDIAAQMLDLAAASDPDGAVEWIQLDPTWRKLPFEPATFDAIVAASVLEYVNRPDAALRECARVLRPGGIVLCTVPDPTHPIRWLEWLAGAAAKVPAVRDAGGAWPKLDRYLTYLQISRHRHTADWWCAAGARAGLMTVPRPADATGHPALRLLTFKQQRHSQETV